MIWAENLSFSYNAVPPYILDGLNLEIKRGEYVSIVGENGCGKSTLMKLILGFLKPTRGGIQTDAYKLGYVPQKSDSANSGFPITVYEMLDSYRRLLKLRDKSAVAEGLRQAGLFGYARTLMGNLSGGQQQKALIARALMGEPDLLLLDEPSAGVDPDSQHEIYALLKRLNTERGLTIVSVEHNLDAAISNSTVIFHLHGGRGHFCTPRQYSEEYLGKGDRRA
ncbi:MAG: metal ABC transporter ATP-binding protein [Oscillospiraceae bacterium]|jgi:zinc transport system ATP-binding protein|nr:metal ABC transporter ATP-binding protein [Oscillospiraceae bacterium]